ncbi:MAG: flavin reductase [Bacteroidales bacterium]|nr:flavin reductase [Bacteroidales bacterium]
MSKENTSLFESIEIEEVNENFFQLLNHDWMLVTAGVLDDFNTMTASWGTFGILWNKPVAIIFIRPHRYTYNFVEKYAHFTLTFFDTRYKDILNFCGQHSGKDVDKVKETGLIPYELSSGAITFEQGRLVIECQKIYFDDLKNDRFLDREIIHRAYPAKDFHRFYIGEITQCYKKQ